MENLISKEPLFVPEAKSGEKQGEDLQGCWCRGGRGAEPCFSWEEGSPWMESKPGRAAACRAQEGQSSSSANATSIPFQSRRRCGRRRMKLKHGFLCFTKLSELPNVLFTVCIGFLLQKVSGPLLSNMFSSFSYHLQNVLPGSCLLVG